MSNNDLQVIEQYRVQGTGDSIPYSLTTTPWGSTPSSAAVTVLDMGASGADVTATVMPAGSLSTSGDVITTKPLTALTAGHVYWVVFTFTVSGKTETVHLTVYALGNVSLTNCYTDVFTFKQMFFPTALFDPIEDRRIGQVIQAVSRKIDDYTHTRFYVNASDEARYFTTEWHDQCDIGDWTSVTSVAVDLDYDGVYEISLTANTDYVLMPRAAQLQSQPEPYTYIRRAILSTYPFPRNVPDGVKVVGKAGYSTAANQPDLVREACLLQAGNLWKRKDTPLGVMGTADIGIVRLPTGLDGDVRDMLEVFRHK